MMSWRYVTVPFGHSAEAVEASVSPFLMVGGGVGHEEVSGATGAGAGDAAVMRSTMPGCSGVVRVALLRASRSLTGMPTLLAMRYHPSPETTVYVPVGFGAGAGGGVGAGTVNPYAARLGSLNPALWS